MAKRWFLAALATLGLVGSTAAQAPLPLPMEGQPPVYQAQFAGDPTLAPAAQFCPPAGPLPEGDGLCTLPNDGTGNAFSDECCGRDGYGLWVNVGGMGLLRQSLGNKVLGFLDPGITVGGTQVFTTTGRLPPPGSQPVVNTHDVSPQMQFGPRASVMWREPCWAFELTGFYLSESTVASTTVIPARIDMGFGFFPAPRGFTPGMFLQNDLVKLSVQTTMYDGEANYRFNTAKNFEWIVGARYLDYQERFNIFTELDPVRRGTLNPLTTSYITDRVHNRITAGQLGFETWQDLTERIGVGGTLKGAWGANFANYEHLLVRGDGFLGPGLHRSETQFSHVYEAALYADFCITEQLKIRAGYQGLWLVDVPLSVSEINFNLNAPGAIFNKTGSVFFHGPMVELRFVF
jgi:hypothetical protein